MAAGLLGRRSEPDVLLLHDLRHLYLLASGNSVHWTAHGQAAHALRDAELLEVVTTCPARQCAKEPGATQRSRRSARRS